MPAPHLTARCCFFTTATRVAQTLTSLVSLTSLTSLSSLASSVFLATLATLAALIGFGWHSTPATAYTLPVSDTLKVSATVVANTPPSTPVLISPDNNSYVTTSLVTFVWRASTDSHGIKDYELSVDGQVKFSNIPTSATTNSNYTLT